MWQGLRFSHAGLCFFSGSHSFLTPPFTAGQKLPGMGTTRLRWCLYQAPAQSLAGKPHPMQRVCARTIFPGVNAMKVCLGKSSASLCRCWGGWSSFLGCWGTLTALVLSCTTVWHKSKWQPAGFVTLQAQRVVWDRPSWPARELHSFSLPQLPGTPQGMHKGRYLGRVCSHTTAVLHIGQQISNKDKNPLPF